MKRSQSGQLKISHEFEVFPTIAQLNYWIIKINFKFFFRFNFNSRICIGKFRFGNLHLFDFPWFLISPVDQTLQYSDYFAM